MITKWLKRLIFLALFLVVAATATGWWLLHGSLATLDGEVALTGLSAPVQVARDANGTVTVDAANQADAMRALGYVHAQERYFEMDLMRRVSAGELSELFGPIAIEKDKAQRVHRIRARVAADLARMTAEQRLALDAYTDGANAGLAALRTRPWPYLLLGQQPKRWAPEDAALVGFAMYFDLQDASDHNELALWRIKPHLPPALYALLTRDGTRWDAPLVGAPRGDATLPTADEVDLRTLPGPPAERHAIGADDIVPGSNNFAVDGTLTADGRAIVADDMHLGLRAPNIWFRARLRYADARAPGGKVDVTGFTLPGLPAVVVGSNTHVAWAFTNGYIDSADWRIHTACGGPGVDASTCVKPASHAELIRVAGAAPVEFEVQETDWGPVLHREGDRLFALRWNAHLPGALGFGLTDMPLAGDVDQALAIADRSAVPAQNFVVGDRSGRLAWRLIGPLAQRAPGCTPALPATDAEQAGVCPPWSIATDRAPRLVDPPMHRLWSANNRTQDGEALARVGDGGYAFAARAKQIRDGLFAKTRFTERDLMAIQLDDRALLLAPWQALLLERARAAGTPALRALADAAFLWEGRASADSVSYRIVRAWRLAVEQRILAGLTAPARQALGKDFTVPNPPQFEGVAWPLVTQRPDNLLPRGYASWDALFESAAKEVQDELRAIGPLAQRTWGERNTAAICHPLARVIPPVGRRWLCMPAEPLAGDGNMPRVTAPDFGASERMVVSPGHEVDGILHMPGGQSGHPLSPFWGAGHAEWVAGSVSSFLPGPTRYTLTLVPARR